MIFVASTSYGVKFEIKAGADVWFGTIYIRANGSIDPPDAPI